MVESMQKGAGEALQVMESGRTQATESTEQLEARLGQFRL